MIFEDLRAFVVVAQHGSFAQAAAFLCIAQSALSKRVQRLEHRMGTALLERRARGVALTQSGHIFLARAQRLVDEVADMERNLSSFAQIPSGEVRIALPQRTCGLLAPPVVERCLKELPLVNLHILEGTPSNVHGWLMRAEADIAMTYNADLGTGFTVKPFLVEPLFLFASNKTAVAQFGKLVPESCSLADLATLPLILPCRPSVLRVLVDRLCTGHGVRPNIIYETDGTSTIRGMVERGMGTTIFSLSTSWSYSVESGHLIAVPFSSPLVNWKMYLACTRREVGAVAISRVYKIVEEELELLLDSRAWPNAKRIVGDVAG
ncbi:LysR family transcriptional regulator [Rhodoferax sp.]|uniref:LysR family transcriptional regulator n=1 Tax=Rhodoferax sp. TaxID=50421 RepID=UPI0026320981|nr:LysR family transcriptional regulator [Rhodoferax sp.]MDD2924654.1 LysR family transcriptional regulator [Rhodoferax sp.]